jgi:hypothetical protein
MDRQQIIGLVLSCCLLLCSLTAIAQPPLGVAPQPSGGANAGQSTGSTNRPADPQSRSNQTVPRSSARNTYVRLARAPNMFGDSLRPSAAFDLSPNLGENRNSRVDLPLGGASSYNIAENNRAMPTDRAYFVYNGFFNAVNSAVPGVRQSSDLHMYTIGFEKTIFDERWSIDTRMPFTSSYDFNSPTLSTDSGNVGNLSMFLKRLVYRDESLALSHGLGVGLPTGKDVAAITPFSRLTVQNEAVHLMPFIAMTATPGDLWFLQSFAQIDFAASGNDVITREGNAGTFTEQNLMHFDIALGRWLAPRLDYRYLTGIASIFELHYTSTIQDSDRIVVNAQGIAGLITTPSNRVDILNLTSGLHFQLNELANLRFGAVVPLRADPDRVFDTELHVSFNRLF